VTKPVFLFDGNGPLLNRGCQAILRATVQMLREEFGPCRFINIQGSPWDLDGYPHRDSDVQHVLPQLARRGGLAWWKRQLLARLLRRPQRSLLEQHLPQATAVLGLGGDNYTLDYGQPHRFFRSIRTVIDHGKPFVIWGASVGPFTKDPQFETQAADVLRHVALICARERRTVQYLRSIGVEHNVRQVADPAFTLQPTPVELKGPEQIVLREPCVGLNLSPLLGRYTGTFEEWTDLAARLVRAVVTSVDLPVVLLPHVTQSPRAPAAERLYRDDHWFMGELMKRTGDFGGRLVLLRRHYDACQLKWIISKFAVFVGARTHATIAAMSSMVPTVSIAYSVKAVGINEELFGGDRWIARLESLNPQTLVDRIADLLAHQDQVREHLRGVIPQYVRKSRLAATYLREAMALDEVER
jgi:polysaccharide pyruvyl transferase WcaK-like protein